MKIHDPLTTSFIPKSGDRDPTTLPGLTFMLTSTVTANLANSFVISRLAYDCEILPYSCLLCAVYWVQGGCLSLLLYSLRRQVPVDRCDSPLSALSTRFLRSADQASFNRPCPVRSHFCQAEPGLLCGWPFRMETFSYILSGVSSETWNNIIQSR